MTGSDISARAALLAKLLTSPDRSWLIWGSAVNGSGSALDHLLLQVLTRLTTTPLWLAVAAGVASGSTVSFFVNRRITFRTRGPRPLSEEAARFIAVMLVLGVIHGFFAAGLRHAGASLLPSKIAADFLILGLGQPVLLRRFVFASPLA